MNLLKKITVKAVCGALPKPDKQTDIMRVVGIATGTRTGATNFGPWIAFTGNFQATNLLTGEVFKSGALLLPDIASNLVVGALGGDNNAVEFAFDIGIKPSASPVGYDYSAKPLLDTSENDPLKHLTERLSALPAPAKKK